MRLFREIGLTSSTLLVIGNIVGIGIFTTSGLIAETLGPSSWLLGVWILGGFLALLGALCYSVLSRHYPNAGGEYAFLYPNLGPLPAFLSGWASLLIGFSAPVAAGALGAGFYLAPFLPFQVGQDSLLPKVTGVIILLLVSVFLSLGLRFGAHLHSAVTLLNLGLMIGFALVVAFKVPIWDNLSPLIQLSPTEVDPSALGSSVILVLFCYSGWNAAAYVAEEVRSPERNVPLSLLVGTLTVIGAYVLVNMAYFGAVPVGELTGKIPVAEITASRALGSTGSTLVNLLILSSILSSLTAMSIAGPRVYFAMSRDRLFPDWLCAVHQVRKLPLRAIWFQNGVALLLVLFGTFTQILLYSGTVLILFSTLTVLTLLKMPKPSPGATFWLLYRLAPALFVVINSLVFLNAAYAHPDTTVAGLLTIAAGIPVYLHYRGKRKTAQA